MYWNPSLFLRLTKIFQININMRCIEICVYENLKQTPLRLTLTWDVLKLI